MTVVVMRVPALVMEQADKHYKGDNRNQQGYECKEKQTGLRLVRKVHS